MVMGLGLSEVGFKFKWWTVTRRGMRALGVLHCNDKTGHGFSCVFDVFGIGWQSSLVKQAPLPALCASLPREGGGLR